MYLPTVRTLYDPPHSSFLAVFFCLIVWRISLCSVLCEQRFPITSSKATWFFLLVIICNTSTEKNCGSRSEMLWRTFGIMCVMSGLKFENSLVPVTNRDRLCLLTLPALFAHHSSFAYSASPLCLLSLICLHANSSHNIISLVFASLPSFAFSLNEKGSGCECTCFQSLVLATVFDRALSDDSF